MLDNLEAIQTLDNLTVPSEHADSLWFLREVCALPAPTQVLLTGRYVVPDLPQGVVHLCPVPDAPYGDVLRRMQRLAWPSTMSTAHKHQMYEVLGGNHRAIEWAAQVLKQEHQQTAELVAAQAALQAPPGTPAEVAHVVVEAMRQNSLCARLRPLLTPTQDRLLRAASLYRVPVNEDGFLAITEHPVQCAEDRQRLVIYALLECGHDPETALDYFVVPPIVREMLKEHGFSPMELRALHRAVGRYHRFQGEHVSRRWSDDVEAIYHFRQAREHIAADEVAEGVSDFYYSISNYTAARALTEEIVQRTSPPPPWWALTRYRMCQLTLGLSESALAAFKRALPIAPTRGDEGATLNNLGQLYNAQGYYSIALGYLKQSLAIQREIGNKAGEGLALNNLGQLYINLGDDDTALSYLEQSLAIQRETGNKAGLVATLHTMGHIAWHANDRERAMTLWSEAFTMAREMQYAKGIFYTARALGRGRALAGAQEEARRLLQLAVAVGKAAGFPDVQKVEAMLRRLPPAEA